MKLYTRKHGLVKGSAVFEVNGFSISWTTVPDRQEILIFPDEKSLKVLENFTGNEEGFIEAVEWCKHADIDVGCDAAN